MSQSPESDNSSAMSVDAGVPTSHQPAVEDDMSVDDRPEAEAGERMEEGEGEGDDEFDDEEEEEEEESQRVKLLPDATDTAASFEFLDEGHTMGNALRYIIMKNPDVEFCAYALPHPSENKMNVRIQTYGGITAIQALEKGLKDLQDLCDVVAVKYWDARNEFEEVKMAA